MFFLIFSGIVFTQERPIEVSLGVPHYFSYSKDKNPNVFPYGGQLEIRKILFQFQDEEQIDSTLTFRKANFDSIHFENDAKFMYSFFNTKAYFGRTNFYKKSIFWSSHFDSLATFSGAQFNDSLSFMFTTFHCDAYFGETIFNKKADFSDTHFNKDAIFTHSKFSNLADFGGAHFKKLGNFRGVKFYGFANFTNAHFDSIGDFRGSHFYSDVDFFDTEFDSLCFEKAIIENKIFIGSREGQKFNFTRSIFFPTTRLELWDLVEIKIQPEKVRYIFLSDKISYNLKRLIIDNLKAKSFNENPKVQFELEYIFNKSTMYQEVNESIENRWYHLWKWPKWFLNTIYYLTMGLGYRPFRLAWWVLGFIIMFSVWYFFSMKEQVNRYIFKDEKKELSNTKRKRTVGSYINIHPAETIINCLYFSSMLFFTIRLKKDVLTFFGLKEKRIIVSEYFIGLLIYIAFLTLSKSGSILHTLKSLFVG